MQHNTFLLFALLSVSALAKDAAWQTVQSAEVQVFTQSSGRDAQEAIRSLGQIRHILLSTLDKDLTLQRPVHLFIFQSSDEFAEFRPIGLKTVAGFFSPGRDRDYIAMSIASPNAKQVLFHEYVHLFLYRSGAQIPFWFNEGMADLYSTAKITGSGIRIGDPVVGRVACLKTGEWPDLNLLFKTGPHSEQLNDAKQAGMFYAQSWALVHMLSLDPRYRSGVGDFLALLKRGSRHAEAFRDAFGKSITEVSKDLRAYTQQSRWPERIVRAESFETSALPELRPAEPVVVAKALAGLMVSLGRRQLRYPQSAAEVNGASTGPGPMTPRTVPPVPLGWENPKGTKRTEGTFLELDCRATSAQFIIGTATGKIALEVDDPTKVVLSNTPGTTAVLACGTQTPREVTAEYDGNGQLTALKFK